MKRKLALLLAVALIITVMFAGCGGDKNENSSGDTSSGQKSESSSSDKPDTWIADRHIVGRAFIDDLGVSLPEDQLNNPVAKKLKELTGMSIEWQYTAGTSDLDVLTTAIAAGDLPDLIVYYLNDSSRPEFPVVLKAAREGMFTDVAPLLKNTKIYSKYFEEGFLPSDTRDNVMFRPEFNGACYIVHMRIPREPGSNDYPMIGGMWLQKSIADALNIDPRTIKTQDQLYDLLKRIKAGGFKDANGNEVYPLGPRIWGGSFNAHVVNNYNFGVSTGFNLLDGKVVHEAETDYVFKQIEFYQKLLAEGLIHPEYFTIDPTRAEELSLNNSAAIIGDAHNYLEIFRNTEYLNVGPLYDYKGENKTYRKGKSGYAAWSIPSTTKNPEEIVKFLDFLATKEGKMLWMYGIEGEHYDMVDGKPVVRQEMLDLMESDRKAANNTGIFMDGNGACWLNFIGGTDVDNISDFGELSYGENRNPDQYAFANKMYEYNPPKNIVYYEGFSSFGFLQELPDIEPQLKPLIDEQAYTEVRVKAIFSGSMDEARKIIESYRKQLKNAGIDEFKEFLLTKYQENPNQIDFH